MHRLTQAEIKESEEYQQAAKDFEQKQKELTEKRIRQSQYDQFEPLINNLYNKFYDKHNF